MEVVLWEQHLAENTQNLQHQERLQVRSALKTLKVVVEVEHPMEWP